MKERVSRGKRLGTTRKGREIGSRRGKRKGKAYYFDLKREERKKDDLDWSGGGVKSVKVKKVK